MNSTQIERLLRSHWQSRNVFFSVHAADIIPPRAREHKPCAYVANAEPHHRPEEHWVISIFPEKGIHNFFIHTEHSDR